VKTGEKRKRRSERTNRCLKEFPVDFMVTEWFGCSKIKEKMY
jgi:hypothetical protein